MSEVSRESERQKSIGLGRVLVVVYGILALAAVARSVYQIATKFEEAPVAYLLSAVAGVVYCVAAVALLRPGRGWRTIAWAAVIFEMCGVLVVGVLSLAMGDLFPHDTVWSGFGRGYIFIPLVLPVLGILWLKRRDSYRTV
ncbi:hypothetical protein [Lysinibacter sp. HNR]|uniref:hypothetical protein n=1 Tax=Lysinibacter sp. HNR TaxID=3031408 RepID=UPI002435AB58|nr:hypothetical protein [Lysinibacter sp. HNR]WGD36693.1 hypothetical protein FrondiHNR_09515 [Lysinibacter sp. HNR]